MTMYGLGAGTTNSSRKSSNIGFFGDIYAGITEGLYRIGSEVLPNWVQSEIIGQSEDQLKQQTFQQEAAPRRIDSTLESAREGDPVDWSLFKFRDIGGGAILIIGALFLAAIFLFKKV